MISMSRYQSRRGRPDFTAILFGDPQQPCALPFVSSPAENGLMRRVIVTGRRPVNGMSREAISPQMELQAR